MYLRCNLHPRDAIHNEFCCDNCFGLSDVFLSEQAFHFHSMGRVTQNVPEKELPVQITDVNGIHVNDMDVLEP